MIQIAATVPKLIESEILAFAQANQRTYEDTVRALLRTGFRIAGEALDANGSLVVKDNGKSTKLVMFKGSTGRIDTTDVDLRAVTTSPGKINLGDQPSRLIKQIEQITKMRTADVFRELLKVALVVTKMTDPDGIFIKDSRVTIF